MTTITHGATVITVDASETVHHDAAVAIEKDRITAQGQATRSSPHTAAPS